MLGRIIEWSARNVFLVILATVFVTAAGIDPVWFGVFILLMCEISLISPPVGMTLYVIQGVRREGSINEVFQGTLPFFLFWMKPMMSAYIGADYQRGLMLLKDYLETGSVRSKLDFIGEKSFPGCRYVGVRTTCPIEEIATHMQRDMKKLTDWLATTGTRPTGQPLNICHKWDHVKLTTEYIIAFPISSPPAAAPTGFVTGEIPTCRTYTVRHTGPYRYLGNAWAAGVMRGRAKVYTVEKKIDAFEVYENDPSAVPEDELVTVLHFPMK